LYAWRFGPVARLAQAFGRIGRLIVTSTREGAMDVRVPGLEVAGLDIAWRVCTNDIPVIFSTCILCV
jgi:hypothetical protein